jgi:hypothetical protein
MNNTINYVLYDDITNYGITIINNEIYLVKGTLCMKLSSLIIKEKEDN